MSRPPRTTLCLLWALCSCSADHVIGSRGSDAGTGPFGSLFCRTDLIVPAYPTSAVLQDLNGDGKLDLLLAHVFDARASVWLGQGDGTFRQLGSYSGQSTDPGKGQGTLPVIAVGDVNQDQRPDLLLGDAPGHVFLGQGDGTFVAASSGGTFPGGIPVSLAVGDVNGDGRPAILVIDRSTDSVRLIPGHGDGTFATAMESTEYQAAKGPQVLRIADLNGDGWPDLALTSWNGNEVSVLFNQKSKDAPFVLPARTYPTGQRPQGMEIADVNHDGAPDLVVADENGDTISVLLNQHDGTFAAAVAYATGRTPISVAMADFTGNQGADLVVANENSDTVSVLLHDGNGGFLQQVSYPTGINPTSVAAGDLNGDQQADFVVTNWNSSSVSIFLNRGAAQAPCSSSR